MAYKVVCEISYPASKPDEYSPIALGWDTVREPGVVEGGGAGLRDLVGGPVGDEPQDQALVRKGVGRP